MQVKDDIELLKLMMKDLEASPEIYKPGNYWLNYQKKSIPEIEKYGLKDFRCRKDTILRTFSANDPAPILGKIDLSECRFFNNRITRIIPFWLKVLKFCSNTLNKVLPVPVYLYGMSIEDLKKSAYEMVTFRAQQAGAKLPNELEISLIGNPEDAFKIGDKYYTWRMLDYYMHYVYCSKFINFDNIYVMVELGAGSGKQIEVLKKLYPDICFLLFDIPPQLYVCEQYLKAVFPNDIISYRNTRNMKSLPQEIKGKIIIFGNWEFPMIERIDIDLFWNGASFQEMEPNIVANYLKYVNKSARSAYLQEVMGGKEIARKKGEHGVLKPTTIEDYKKGLSNFELVDMSDSLMPLGIQPGHSDSFWRRK